MKSLFLADIIKGTATEQEGTKFYHALFPFLREEMRVNISLQNTTPMSSDFFAASIGEIVEEFGIEKFKNLVSFTHFTKFQAKQLQSYFKILQDYA